MNTTTIVKVTDRVPECVDAVGGGSLVVIAFVFCAFFVGVLVEKFR